MSERPESRPPPEILEKYRKQLRNQKTPTKIPNEDFSKLKAELLELRALAESKAKEGPIAATDLSDWRHKFVDLALQRPTLFNLVANPEKDMKIALGMVDILQNQREAKNYSLEDSNHQLVHYMCDQTGFEKGKTLLAQAEKEIRDARKKQKR
jgi:hypothetical protein